MAKETDKYSNKMYATVTESAANTLTFSEIKTNVSVFDKVAWILHRLEYYWPLATLQLLAAAGDILQMALTSSENVASLDLSSPSIIDMFERQYVNYGTAASAMLWENPLVRDFSRLPGGGIIVAPRPLYLAVEGASLASAATVSMRGYFTVKELAADEYLELIDFYRIVQ